MATSIENLAARLERLERRFEEAAMVRSHDIDAAAPNVQRFWARIPFGAWLKISGPTFAVMALGFGTVWNAQQETTRQIMDLQQETTRQIMELQESTTDRILAVQDRILAMEQTTTDRILEMQRTTTDRILEMQQQILDLHRESRAERG